MELKTTYENPNIHRNWQSGYRGNPLQDRLNGRILDRLIGLMQPPAGARFLDAGCGDGVHTREIAQRGYHCTGVDISEHILERARELTRAAGMDESCSFDCQRLEHLEFPDGTFDCVHVRGVLMHIPEWEQALGELCRVLKPGGRIAILEASQTAVEPRVVGLIRTFRRSKSRIVATPGGLEAWTEIDGQPFVVRNANMRNLADWLRDRGFRDIRRTATEFWDISRYPSGPVRNAVIRFNALYFALGGPAGPSVGNAIVGRKAAE